MTEDKDEYLCLLQHVFGGELFDNVFVTQAEVMLIRNAIDSLTPRESFVIVQRYFNKETLATISRKLPRLRDPETNKRILTENHDYVGVTKERVRQIEAKALRKLRHPSRSRPLLPIIERIFLPDENKNA